MSGSRSRRAQWSALAGGSSSSRRAQWSALAGGPGSSRHRAPACARFAPAVAGALLVRPCSAATKGPCFSKLPGGARTASQRRNVTAGCELRRDEINERSRSAVGSDLADEKNSASLSTAIARWKVTTPPTAKMVGPGHFPSYGNSDLTFKEYSFAVDRRMVARVLPEPRHQRSHAQRVQLRCRRRMVAPDSSRTAATAISRSKSAASLSAEGWWVPDSSRTAATAISRSKSAASLSAKDGGSQVLPAAFRHIYGPAHHCKTVWIGEG